VGWKYDFELASKLFSSNCRVSLPTQQLIKSERYIISFHLFVNWGMSANLVLGAIQ